MQRVRESATRACATEWRGRCPDLDFPARSRKVAHHDNNMPFFTRDGDTFHPTEVANGPWDPKSLHGRVIIGLLGFAIEERHAAMTSCRRG